MTTPTRPTTLTARSPEDLLAVAPVVLGFWPTDSVVMLTFGSRHPFHARVDLPAPGDARAGCRDVAEALVGPAAHHDVSRVVLLVYSAHPALSRDCWAAMDTAFRLADIEVLDVVRVDGARWYPLRTTDRRSVEGVAYDVSAHPFLAQAVLDGRVTHRSRDDLAATLVPDAAAIARVAALVVPGRPESPADELAEGTWVVHLVRSDATLEDVDLARLVRGVQATRVRDAAWSTIDRGSARAAIDFWSDVVRRTPSPLLAAPAALLAWAAWQHGNGALAWCALDRCREVDADYPLAAILAEALERAVPPSVWIGDFDWMQGLEGHLSA